MDQSDGFFSEGEAGQDRSARSCLNVGVLLVHGLNGCLSDMAEIGEMLTAHGFVTKSILLPGHGTRVQDLSAVGWSDWAQALREELQQFRAHCPRVFLVGHSLGGALCLHTAAHEPVAGLVTMCAPAYMPPWMLPAVSLVRRVTPFLPTYGRDICDAQARRSYKRAIYRWTPMAPVESMLQYLPRLRAELSSVTAPALIMSAVHDHVVPACDGQTIYRLLGSHEKELVTFYRSYHLLMKDHDREDVLARMLAFIRHHAELLPSENDKRAG
jgi:carboxylesterase